MIAPAMDRSHNQISVKVVSCGGLPRTLRRAWPAPRRVCGLIALAAIMHACGAQQPPKAQQPQIGSPGDYTLNLNTNLVILNATVFDRHGALVSGLGKDNFQVYEDGVLQQVKNFSHEDIPVAVGILVDNSGSMTPYRSDVIAAALAFARSSNPQDQMFELNFNDRVTFGLPRNKPFTDRQDELERALASFNTIGQTSLYDGIAAGLDHLKSATREKRVLILISDGGDDASKHNSRQVLEIAPRSSVIIYAIGIFSEDDADQNPKVLKRFAAETGGEAFFPHSSKEILPICERIAHDIRNQYTLSYVPAVASPDKNYRTILVKANGLDRGRLSVRTRTGYFAPTPQSTANGLSQ